MLETIFKGKQEFSSGVFIVVRKSVLFSSLRFYEQKRMS